VVTKKINTVLRSRHAGDGGLTPLAKDLYRLRASNELYKDIRSFLFISLPPSPPAITCIIS
jgi:hypothetical protein